MATIAWLLGFLFLIEAFDLRIKSNRSRLGRGEG
jgi:hypothetical protein